MGLETPIDHHLILELLPHRFPFLLVDRVIEIEPGQRIVAVKNVSGTEPWFPGHFPGEPIMPGVLVLEAMAQTAALLAFLSSGQEGGARPGPVLLMGMDGARFRRQVLPGDQLRIEVSLITARHRIWKFKARATVDGVRTAEAELMATARSS